MQNTSGIQTEKEIGTKQKTKKKNKGKKKKKREKAIANNTAGSGNQTIQNGQKREADDDKGIKRRKKEHFLLSGSNGL